VLNAREKVFRPQWEFAFRKRSRRQPVAFRAGESDGILVSRPKQASSLCSLCGPLCLCGDRFSRQIHHRDTEGSLRSTERIANRRVLRSSLADFALLLIIATLIALTGSCSRQRDQNSSSTTEFREVTDEAARPVH